jgi:endo-1,3(4)-beta-glucanase
MPDNGQDPNLHYVSNTMYRGPSGFNGVIQVAKNPFGAAGESMYDGAAGAYAVRCRVAGSATGRQGQYSLIWTKQGRPNTPLLMFALPHHVLSFDSTTRSHQLGFQLTTTTKGKATAVIADSWTMLEPKLPIGIGFAPWDPVSGSVSVLSAGAKATIHNVAVSEVGQNMDGLINDASMYFSGKRASKFATLLYTIHDLLGDQALADAALTKLKAAVARFVENRQQFPLVYETAWKGCVSSAAYVTGDPISDFGNTYYNDHQLQVSHASSLLSLTAFVHR